MIYKGDGLLAEEKETGRSPVMNTKRNVLVFLLALCLTLCAFAATAFAAEISISTADDLLQLAQEVNAGTSHAGDIIRLTADIDLSGREWTPIGMGDNYFKGEFDGQGHTIKNLKQTSGTRMGLFGLTESAYLHDLTLKDFTFVVTGNGARVGALAGNLQHWNVVKDVTVDGVNITVTGNDGLIGGVVGYVWRSQLSNVDAKNVTINANGTGSVVTAHSAYARGHSWDTDTVAKNDHWLPGTTFGTSVVQNLWMDCDVNGAKITVNGGGVAGGFLGQTTYNYHTNYLNNCHVTGLDMECLNGSYQAGGFIGYNRGNTAAVGTSGLAEKSFANCSASGKIKGDAGTYGGFIGVVNGRAHRYDDASTSVNITASSSSTVGGFVGATGSYFDHMYTFNQCAATGSLSGGTVGGFAGNLGVGGDGSGVYATIIKCTGSSATKDFIGRISSWKGKDGEYKPVDVVVKVTYTGKAQQLSVGGQSAVFSQNGKTVQAIDCDEYQMDLSLEGSSINTRFVILPAEITIQAKDQRMTLNGQMPAFTYTVAGLCGNDQLLKRPSLTVNTDGKTKGIFEIVPSGADAGKNYTFKYINGTLTVQDGKTIPSDASSATLPPKTGVDGVEGYATLALASLLCAAALVVLRRRTAR